MKTFAQRQTRSQQESSTNLTSWNAWVPTASHAQNSILHSRPTNGNQSALRTPEAETRNLVSHPEAATHFAHDFSRIPLHTPAPVTIQPKLTVNTPGDAYEQEADHVAEQVMRMSEPNRSACACGGGCSTCQSGSGGNEHPSLQTKHLGSSDSGQIAAPPIVHEVLASYGQPLDASTRAFFEPRFGQDFSGVRVHTDRAAGQSARDVNASAYTVGHDIVFGTGRYSPRTLAGQHILAHELVHTLQQSGGNARAVTQHTPQTNRLGQNQHAFLQRRESGSGFKDPLFMADHEWSSGQGPDDRVTGRILQNWAIARGSFVVRSDVTLMRMQEKDGVEPEILDDIRLLLMDLLYGHDARDPTGPEYIRVGPGRPYRPEYEPASHLDKFEGSDNARATAVQELLDHWGPIESYFIGALMRRYSDSYLEAAGRTPKEMSLEEDAEEIKRIRTNPYHHEYRFDQGMAGNVLVRTGQRWGRLHIIDIYKLGGPAAEGEGTVWAYLDGHPLWYYSGRLGLFNRNAFTGEAARGIAETAQFAGLLFPLMIKAGGFALSFSPNPLVMIAGVVLEELGEEGLRDLNGQGRSFKDVASGAAREILINLVLGKLMGGGGEGKAGSEAAAALDKVAEKAAIRIRQSVEKEIVSSEGPQIVKAVEAGEARIVHNEELLHEGFTFEVEIKHEGGPHTYRMKADGEWCRWSARRLCGLDLSEIREVRERIIHEREGMVASDKRVLEETGMKETPGVPGPVPIESGVKGELGEAGHATEVTTRVPKPLKELSSAADIVKERDALLRGDVTLREVVEKYPPEGAAQVFFPTAKGAGRYIDHVYLDSNTMFVVFRESKNYGRFSLASKELFQLEKDLAFLAHPRFKGVRIEWRISGGVERDTLATLAKIESDTNGLFRYVLDPGVP